GQYSPTSEIGKKTKSSPQGTVDYPLNPLTLALGVEASFVARTVDTDVKHMGEILEAAGRHRGTAFVEIYQNCVIFNDDAFHPVPDKESRDDRSLKLIEGKPLIFGKEKNKGIRLKGFEPTVVQFDPASPPSDLLVHRTDLADPTYATLLSRMDLPEMPIPLGVFRAIRKPTYEEMLNGQIQDALAKNGKGSLEKLLQSGDTWTVGGG